ncbi:hypothetical protein [Amycolatopsis samaneae]|uniref:Uncharacterized protein n=1 Tax=Amycolatopsis samaneae TaxID=664691 RepID=A0ABW5G9Z3_9PSEU
MRKLPTWQTTRKALTATALAALVTGGAFLSSGTASAATTLANGCSGTVNGSMGDTVAVQGSSVKELVRTAAREQVGLFNFLTVWPDALADTIANKGALGVGQVPQSAGGPIQGDAIGTAVSNALKGSNGLGVLPSTQNQVLSAIQKKVAGNCGLTTLATNYSPPSTPRSDPASPGSRPGGAGASTSPNGGGNLANLLPGSGTGTAPQRDYSGIPTATPGVAVAPGVRYPATGQLPGDGTAPQFGQGQDGSSGQGADIRNAGNAESLASSNAVNTVQLPMLLAVIVLAGVTAGLVRTWVLRRTS